MWPAHAYRQGPSPGTPAAAAVPVLRCRAHRPRQPSPAPPSRRQLALGTGDHRRDRTPPGPSIRRTSRNDPGGQGGDQRACGTRPPGAIAGPPRSPATRKRPPGSLLRSHPWPRHGECPGSVTVLRPPQARCVVRQSSQAPTWPAKMIGARRLVTRPGRLPDVRDSYPSACIPWRGDQYLRCSAASNEVTPSWATRYIGTVVVVDRKAERCSHWLGELVREGGSINDVTRHDLLVVLLGHGEEWRQRLMSECRTRLGGHRCAGSRSGGADHRTARKPGATRIIGSLRQEAQ